MYTLTWDKQYEQDIYFGTFFRKNPWSFLINSFIKKVVPVYPQKEIGSPKEIQKVTGKQSSSYLGTNER